MTVPPSPEASTGGLTPLTQRQGLLASVGIATLILACLSALPFLLAPPSPEDRFEDPVPGGSASGLERSGFTVLDTNYTVIEEDDDRGSAQVSHYLSVEQTSCSSSDTSCLRSLISDRDWVRSVEGNGPDSFRLRVDQCFGTMSRHAESFTKPQWVDPDLDISGSWRFTLRCDYG